MTRKARQPSLIIGVGASAGGLEAFKQLLPVLPADRGMAFLLVQHLDPKHESLLTELLAPHTDMQVVEAEQGMRIEPDRVYIIRPDTALAVKRGRIELSQPTLHRGVRLPVDHLFRSLAHEYRHRAVGIVLSGAGSDGSAGIRDIKGAGGLVLVQEPASCGQPGMPTSAIDTGLTDLVLEIDAMPAALERFSALPPGAMVQPANDPVPEPDEPTEHFSDQELARLSALLEAHLQFDVSVYKTATVERRVIRRMLLSGFDELDPYLDHVRQNRSEQQTLVRDLLISVTDFFRDPQAFVALREMVVDPVVQAAQPGETVRVWVPGCATGEEAYSLGIEFLDAFAAHDKHLYLQIFATDVDQEALTVARTGVYPLSIAEHVPAHRLRTYFKALDGKGYQVQPLLRDAVSFAVHDLTKDPPFSRMDLVSCRNVMIYLTSEVQQQVLKVLHFALRAEGHLLLSTSESTGQQRELFSTVSKSWRIYRKLGASRPLAVERSRSRTRFTASERTQAPADPPARRPVGSADQARRSVLAAWAPPTVVVAEDGSMLFMHGELGPFLRFPQGTDPRLELSTVLRPEIATRARGAFYKCRRDGERVVALSSPDGGIGRRFRITAHPASELGEGTVILSFEVLQEPLSEPSGVPEIPGQDAVIEQLERELQATREDLRNTVEELETSNEELRSSNEESMSMNEELQSANEELEATTEELRSLNEELTTVNAQLREKVEQLEQAHDDLNNFFASAKVATVFLDEQFCVKRYTPAAAELLRIDNGDLGRPVGDIARPLLQNGLLQEAADVLEHLSARHRELRAGDGRWIARQVLPYRTESRRIEGVVVTLIDITELKAATERLEMRERQQAVIARLGLHALREPDLSSFMEQAVRDVRQTLDVEYCKILELQPGAERLLLRAGIGWQEGLVGSAHIDAGANSQAGYTMQSGEPVLVEDLSTEKRFSGPPLLTEHGVVSGLSCVIRCGDHDYGVIGAHDRERRRFGAEDANFLQAVASVVGSAIARFQSRARLSLERGVATELADAESLEDAMVGVFHCFSTELDTDLQELWWANGDQLTCRQHDSQPPLDAETVRQQFSTGAFPSGHGLVGRVHQQRRAAWCTDLGDSALFQRRQAAGRLGLLSGLGLPIRSGNEVLGVMTVFSRARLFADDNFLRSLEAIGRAIGDFVSRIDAERRGRRLAAITASSHDAIFSHDADGRITEWLPGAERLFGYAADEMIGSSVERLIPEDRLDELWAVHHRILQGEVVEPFETIRRCQDGRLVEVSIRSSPVKDDSGRVIEVSSADRDVSRQKEAERRLLAADQQKDEFLAMLGHELRNPMAAIQSAAELVKLIAADDPRLVQAQQILGRQTSHVIKLLDGLLDVSRIIRGKIRIETGLVDLAQVCRDVLEALRARTVDRQLAITARLPEEPCWVNGDRVRLAQIVDNLMSNAVKYTREGDSIELDLQQHDGQAVLSVLDSGIGIEPELLPHVFEIFRQSQQSLDRAYGGLGLGLSLVKALAELHDGSVEAHSDGENQGSRFVVRLPVAPQAPPTASDKPRHPSRSLTILLVEDNADSAEMLRRLLELTGHRVTVAGNGEQALGLARRPVPDVVLCDIGLPGSMNGFGVAEALRADAAFSEVRLVALTGYGRPEDQQRATAAGFDAHVTKPVQADTLEQIFAGLDL